MNLYICIGRTGKDIELKKSKAGNPYCTFSLAVDSGYGEKKVTYWHEFIAYGKTAETLSKYVKKGTKIIIENSEAVRNTWTDKDGNKRYSTLFTVNKFAFVESKNQNANNQESGQAKPQEGNNDTSASDNWTPIVPGVGVDMDSELPFS